MPVETIERSTEQAPGEDLAALLQRVLAEADISQRELSRRTGIPVATLSAWMTRRRGQAGGIDPAVLRQLAEGVRGFATVAEIFEAAGRVVPAELDEARKDRLLKYFYAMDAQQQRALIAQAELMTRATRVPRGVAE